MRTFHTRNVCNGTNSFSGRTGALKPMLRTNDHITNPFCKATIPNGSKRSPSGSLHPQVEAVLVPRARAFESPRSFIQPPTTRTTRKHPKAKSHSSNRARDLDPRKLVKMAGSLMQSVGGCEQLSEDDHGRGVKGLAVASAAFSPALLAPLPQRNQPPFCLSN